MDITPIRSSFKDFQESISKCYHILGVSPVYDSCRREATNLKRPPKIFWICFLLIYCFGVTAIFYLEGFKKNTVSKIADSIQTVLRTTAIVIIVTNSLCKYRTYHSIIHQFQSIDYLLLKLNKEIDYKKHSKLFDIPSILFVVVLLCIYSFDFYVNIVKYRATSIFYWMLHSPSSLIYVAALHQAIVYFFCVHHRLQLINELLVLEKQQEGIALEKASKSTAPPTIIERVIMNCNEFAQDHLMNKLHGIMTEVFILCDKVNDYFGLVLLMSLAVLFVETSIQCFCCFIIAGDLDEAKNQSIWTLFVCIHLILINFSLVTILSYASEAVSTDANNIQVNVLRLKVS